MELSSLVVDLRQLRYVVAVAEERHFGRTAERLHITQPSLSRAIEQLERDLGVALLERSPARVAPIAAREVLLDEARTVLDQVARARTRVVGAAGPALGTLGRSCARRTSACRPSCGTATWARCRWATSSRPASSPCRSPTTRPASSSSRGGPATGTPLVRAVVAVAAAVFAHTSRPGAAAAPSGR
ncbi:hypothetical protein GCM10023200_54580 [Actinomycetospora chlora]|uniref:HTH lysR-type domain-containing protein n=1 Tax=Actinomycetospora chlora TaxID=663608 RepID=A0ABP9CF66_9PSEU